MPFGKKIVLHTPSSVTPRLDGLVAQFIRDGVAFVAVVGKNCALIENMIDELVVMGQVTGDGSTERFILTTSHPDETLDEAIAFGRMLTGEHVGEVEVVELI